MTDQAPPRIVEHTVAYEHPHNVRPGGVVALSQYQAATDPEYRRRGTVCVVRYVATVPENVTGRGAAPLLARLLDSLPEAAPIRLFLGLTFGGRELARSVIVPTLEAARTEQARAADAAGDDEAAARARRSLWTKTYAVDVGPAAAKVDRVVTVHQRLASVATGLELDELSIPADLPRVDELHRAIRSYNPIRRVTAEGRDEWGVDPYEGVLTALTVAFTEAQVRPARIHVPTGRIPRRITGPYGGTSRYVDLGGGISGTYQSGSVPPRSPWRGR